MEHHEGVGLVFRVLAWAIVAWTLFLIVRKLLRKADILPWPPFKTRDEYIAGAIEMDLDEFAQRAKVTPREVLSKVPPIPPAAPSLPEFGTNPLASLVGVMATAAIAAAASSLGGSQAQKNAARDRKLAEIFLPDRWFRRNSGTQDSAPPCGTLVKVISTYDGVVTCSHAGGISSFLPRDLVPATPRMGEWWRWTREGILESGFNVISVAPFAWIDSQICPQTEKDVVLGNLEPVNFGTKPPPPDWDAIANRFPEGRWVRVKATEVGTGPTQPCELVQVTRSSGGYVTCKYGEIPGRASGVVTFRADELEPAFPKLDEFWRWTKVGYYARPVMWVAPDGHTFLMDVEAGHLVPVNFGKGEKSQA